MIFLTRLDLRPNSRQVQKEIADPYQMHKTFSRAFGQGDNYKKARFLFRVESPAGIPVVLIQSLIKPDWSFLREKADYIRSEPMVKAVNLRIDRGQKLRFRLQANPTVKRDGKRHPLYKEQDQIEWIKRKGVNGGFALESVRLSPCGDRLSKISKGKRAKHFGVCFDGILTVVDPVSMIDTVKSGVGSAKGFGYGLLSLAPA